MRIEAKINKLLSFIKIEDYKNAYAFVSLGKPNVKATIKLLKKTNYIEREINKLCLKFKKKSGEYPQWIKLDFVTGEENISFKQIKEELEETRRNYVQFGIAFDQYWNLAFLPEEININAFVKPNKETGNLELSEDNINNYLRKYTNHKKGFTHEFYNDKNVIKFFTQSFILDEEEVFELWPEGNRKGLRKVDNLSDEIDKLINSSVPYLLNMLGENGKYNYGYFPHFDKKINFYNILRHSSSTYALIEGLTYIDQSVEPVEKAIDFIIENYILEKDGNCYVFDDTENSNEIKLGQNASFIFAICEYLKVKNNERYLKVAQKVANGILTMINKDTFETTHVLNYPDLSVKEKFRIVYYDGEAALALLRLYQHDKNNLWLETVENLFEFFIKNEYWQYHDHWLGYCTNELVQIKPEDKYIISGIKNVNENLAFIRRNKLAFATFLELLMATYRLIQKAKSIGKQNLINENIDEDKFIDTIHLRADYQRIGYFYPEVAMYFKNPQRILGSFFVKDQGYRVRIDDIEHFLSGYVQYQKAFKD